jgi:hypothetical protein
LGTPFPFLEEISQVLLAFFALPIRDSPLFERDNTGELALILSKGMGRGRLYFLYFDSFCKS